MTINIQAVLKGDSKDIVSEIKKALGNTFNAKIGVDTNSITKGINEALKSNKINSVKLGVNGDALVKELNRITKGAKVEVPIKLSGVSQALKELKELKSLVTSLNKGVNVKVNTKVEQSGAVSVTKGTTTKRSSNGGNKDEEDGWKSLKAQRAMSIAQMDKAFQEFGKGSKELAKAQREFERISKQSRDFARTTGTQGINSLLKELENHIGANLDNGFVRGTLLTQYRKLERDRDRLDKDLHPDKYAREEAIAKFKETSAINKGLDADINTIKSYVAQAYKEQVEAIKAETKKIKEQADQEILEQKMYNAREKAKYQDAKTTYNRLVAEHSDDEATRKQIELAKKEKNDKIKEQAKDEETLQKSINTFLKENLRLSKELEKTEKYRADTLNKLALAQSKANLQSISQSARLDSRLNNTKMQNFFDELQNYRNLVGDNKSSFFINAGRDLGINSQHPYFNAMRQLYQTAQAEERKWKEKPVVDVDVKGAEKLDNVNQKVSSITQQFNRLRAEALKAGNALNQATDPKDIERLRKPFNEAIQALVNYQRATRGLTKGQEGQLVEKLAVGNIKEGTEAYKELVKWIKNAVQAQRTLDVETGKRLPQKSKDTSFADWLKNFDVGSALSNTAYAARGNLNFIQSLGNLVSSLSKVNGVVGLMSKALGGVAIAGLAVYAVINTVTNAFDYLVNTLQQIGQTIYTILKPGIDLYRTRQSAELSLAAAISSRATENGNKITFDRGMEISKDLMEQVVADAARSAFNPQELIDALRGTLPLAFGKGFNLEQAYEITKGVAAVAKVINLAPNQVLQETRDLFQGSVTSKNSQVAGALGITNDALKEAEAQGKLYDYIIDSMRGFTQALDRYSQTLSGSLDRMSETFGVMTEKVFAKIAPAVTAFINHLTDEYIGGYVDKATGQRLINSEDFYTEYTDEEGKTRRKYKEVDAVAPENFDWVTSFGDALKELAVFIAPIIDELVEFVQQLTGESDPIEAVVDIIKLLIRSFATLAEFIGGAVIITLKAIQDLEVPISILISLCIQLVSACFYVVKAFGVGGLLTALGDLYDFVVNVVKGIQALIKGDFEGAKASFGNSAGNLVDAVKDVVMQNNPLYNIKQFVDGFGISTSYDELLGKPGASSKMGAVSRLVDEALNNQSQPKEDKEEIDREKILGKALADATKTGIQEQKRMLQEKLEQLKQDLKQALAELKDIAEKNELAYKQGYKSVEDYFTQKAALEAEEARLKLETAVAERNAVAQLDTGGDANAEYQKNRDLIRYNSEIATYSREYDKKAAQQVDLLRAINNTLNNKTYKTGIVANDSSSSSSSSSQAIPTPEGIYYDVAEDADIDNLTELTKRKLNAIAYEYFNTYGERMFVTSGARDGNGDSWHDSGQAFDIAMDSLYDETRRRFLDEIAPKYGLIPLDEYPGEDGAKWAHGDNFHFSDHGDYFEEVEELVDSIDEDATEAKNQLVGHMPEAFSDLGNQYQQVIKQGQKQLIEAQKEYAQRTNNSDLLKQISFEETTADMNENISIARKKFAEMPAIADNLEKLLPLKQIDAIVSAMSSTIETRMKTLEHDAKVLNLDLQNKLMLFPDAIHRYFNHFFSNESQFSIGSQIDTLMKQADEYSKLGETDKFQEIMNKVNELQSKLYSMVESWLDEMSKYFDYKRNLIDADSGLTSFVKEDAKKQYDKGEARVKAQAYRSLEYELGQRAIELQKQLNEQKAKTNDYNGTANNQALNQIRLLQEQARRQAEINEKLGEQKTLWQETMDAANQALEDSLYNFMTEGINTAESIGEAFRNMAVDILKDLQKFFAKKAITDLMYTITGQPNTEYTAPNAAEIQTSINTGQIVGWLQNIYRMLLSMLSSQQSSTFSNIGSSVAGVLTSGGEDSIAGKILNGHATGGYITGPGTGTSDSIPAMLSNGEYVIKAEAVKRYGTNFLNAVNSGAFTRMRTSIPRFAEGGYVGDALQDTARGMTDFAKSIGTSVSTTNNMNIALVEDREAGMNHFMRSPKGQNILVDFMKGNGRVFARFNS